MTADDQRQPNARGSRTPRGAVQAFIAIVAAAAVIGGLLVLTEAMGDDSPRPAIGAAGSTTLLPTLVTTESTTSTQPALAPTVESSTTVPATTVPATTVTATTVTATTVPVTSPVVTAPASPVPGVDAAAYAVYDVAAQRWLADDNADAPRAVGSVMKLLSVYVGMQAGDPEHLATVPPLDLDSKESSIGLREGEQFSRALLMRAMLIVSANDAARTLAVDVAGSEDAFVQQMNAAAQSLGLANTVAANPVGLDDSAAHSSARDVAQLAAILMQDPTFRETVARRSAKLHGTTFAATNKLLASYEGADGVKTGHTTGAGWCVVASATRDGREIIVVVLGSSTDDARFAAAASLLDWAFEQ